MIRSLVSFMVVFGALQARADQPSDWQRDSGSFADQNDRAKVKDFVDTLLGDGQPRKPAEATPDPNPDLSLSPSPPAH